MLNKSYKSYYIGVFVVCGVLLVLGGFFDFRLTNALYNPAPTWETLLAGLGGLPIYFALPMFSAMVIFSATYSNNIFKISKNKLLWKIVGFVGLVFSYAFLFLHAQMDFKAIFIGDDILAPIIITVTIGTVSTYLLYKSLKESTREKLYIITRFFIVYCIIAVVVALLLKEIFGRVRYEDILQGGTFTNWFNPTFFGGGSSFPSGHTTSGCGAFVLLLVPYIFSSQAKNKGIWFAVSIVIIILVGAGRILVGKHFLSDVTAAVAITLTIFIALSSWFDKRGLFKY